MDNRQQLNADDSFFSASFQQSFVVIYKLLWGVVQCSFVLRYFCARSTFSKRLKIQWLARGGERVDPERADLLKYRLVSDRLGGEIYHGEIPKNFGAMILSEGEMLLILLISIHSKFHFDETDSQTGKLLPSRYTVAWVQQLNLDVSDTVIQRLVLTGLPPLTVIDRSRVSVRCYKCGTLCTRRDFRNCEIRKTSRLCRQCAPVRGKKNRERFKLNREDPLRVRARIEFGLSSSSHLALAQVCMSMETPLVELVGAQIDVVTPIIRPRDAYLPVGYQIEMYLCNTNPFPVEVCIGDRRREGDGKTFHELIDADFVGERELTIDQLTTTPGYRRIMLGPVGCATAEDQSSWGDRNWQVHASTQSQIVPVGGVAFNSHWLQICAFGLLGRQLAMPVIVNIRANIELIYL